MRRWAGMGPGIIIPVLLVAVVVPVVFVMAYRRFKEPASRDAALPSAPAATVDEQGATCSRLTAVAGCVRDPPPSGVGRMEHVLIGPVGVFARSRPRWTRCLRPWPIPIRMRSRRRRSCVKR